MKQLCLLIGLIILSGCSGGAGGGVSSGLSTSTSTSVIPASQVETTKLQEAMKTDPVYKIEDSEITLLQNEGILIEADKAQLQAIK